MIKHILADDKIDAFSTFKKTECHKALKSIIGPFLVKDPNNPGEAAHEAHRNLFLIVSDARDLSAKMLSSGLTFQHEWPHVGLRFFAAAYEPVNSVRGRLELEREGCRIKFAATPSVTLRDDRGMAIKTTNLLQPGVLVTRG